MIKRITALFFGLLMVFSCLIGFSKPVQAAKKVETKRSIAIVFDNSGSMYWKKTKDGGYDYNIKSWCQATYATEVFASMANDGDEIAIYPMNTMSARGQTYAPGSPLVVQGGGDASIIHDIQDVTWDRGTPVESITEAYQGLQNMDGDEKWLIVLTDGENFNEGTDSAMSKDDTKARLEVMLGECVQTVNVIYLGMGTAQNLIPQVSSNSNYHYYGYAADTASVPSKLTEVCNLIFGRDELNTASETIDFDLDMNKLILFVQGTDIDGLALYDESGNALSNTGKTYNPTYSTQGTIDPAQVCAYDDTLSGQIVTFTEVPKGTYTIRYNGNARSTGVYYEPDVTIIAYLEDADGNPVTDYENVKPGTYHLRYGLGKNNEFIDSDLLGERHFVVTYTVNGETQTVESNGYDSVEITIGEGSTLEAAIDASYLSGYVDHKDTTDFGWPAGGITTGSTPELMVTVVGPESITLAQVEETVFEVRLEANGSLVSGNDATLDVQILGDGAPDVETTPTDSGFTVTLKYPGGSADQMGTGTFTIMAHADYEGEDGLPASADGSADFEVEDVAKDFTIKVKAEQDYYTLAKLEKGDPIRITGSLDGEVLSGQWLFDNVILDTHGFSYNAVAEGDALMLYPVKTEETSTGFYKIEASAEATDNMGRTVTASDSETVEIQLYPWWLRLVLILLIILLILALIWWYLNQKILPKQIGVAKTSFTVDGITVTGNADVKFTGKKKKHGRLDIKSPKCGFNPSAKCGVSLELLADTPRRYKSKSRSCLVTQVSPTNKNNISTIKVGAVNFIMNDSGKLVKAGARPGAEKQPLNIKLANSGKVMISGEVMDPMNGGTNSISLSVTLKFL